ncbi:MAG TPA: cytochrome c family protein [Patescibacteria group bacterium]|nr:cytochrome c family protein [Patescibacteria group bacterium]
MHDLELNKILAACLVAGIIASASGFAAKKLVHPHEVKASGAEATGEAAVPAAPAMPEPYLGLIAKADAEHGKSLAKACGACHNFDKGGPNGVGPNLWDVLTRGKAAKADFSYSDDMSKHKGEKWSYEDLNHFIWKPKSFVPGTKMTFPGFSKAQDRADVVAFLRTLTESPPALPSDTEIAAEAKELAPKPAPAGESKGADNAGAAAAPEGPEPVADLLAKADAEHGKAIAKVCGACHNFDKGGPNGVGPNLWDVLNRGKAAKADYSYSDDMAKRKGEKWTYDDVNHFIWKPRSFVPGTKMTFPGLPKTQDRADVIAFLRTLSDSPLALPAAGEAPAEKKPEPAAAGETGETPRPPPQE